MQQVALSLGSNLGEREKNLENALKALSDHISFSRVSKVFLTSPLEYHRQPYFYNLCALGDTSLSPPALLNFCQSIEIAIAPPKSIPKGPRHIDIDILFHGRTQVQGDRLHIPHRSYRERLFVLLPLLDMDPYFKNPVTGKKLLKDYLEGQFTDQHIRRLDMDISLQPILKAPA